MTAAETRPPCDGVCFHIRYRLCDGESAGDCDPPRDCDVVGVTASHVDNGLGGM